MHLRACSPHHQLLRLLLLLLLLVVLPPPTHATPQVRAYLGHAGEVLRTGWSANGMLVASGGRAVCCVVCCLVCCVVWCGMVAVRAEGVGASGGWG